MYRVLVVLLVAAALPCLAQTCDFALCPAGTTYAAGGIDSGGPYGSCSSCNWFGYCSHSLNHCPSGSTLNLSTGLCTWNVCSGCGGELPLCDAPSYYTGSGTDSAGVYGVCTTGPVPPGGYLSHELKHCRTGWSLVSATGKCHKNCLADLTPRTAWLRNASKSIVTSIKAYSPYFICVDAANVGASASRSFTVAGGGLGVPVAPSSTAPALEAGASAEVCLAYSTTPAPGTYRVGISVDSTGLVAEANESNNSIIVTVTITP